MEPEIHASPLSDASKKRLIEDTEDWHPRSGTSQSRSFQILAQLTGTEKGKYQARSCGRSWVLDADSADVLIQTRTSYFDINPKMITFFAYY